MNGISYKVAGTLENNKKYNGIEFDEDLGLNIYEAFYRHLDPQTGRWWEIDPKIDAGYENVTPYNSMFNDPVRYSDFMGDEAGDGDGIWKDIKSAAKETWSSFKEGARDVYWNGIIPGCNWINENINPLTPLVETATGKSYSSGFTENKSRIQSATELGITFLPMGKIEGALLKYAEKTEVKAVEKDVIKTFGGKQSTESITSKEAFGKAKEANGIPRSQQPDKIIKVNTPEGKAAGLDSRNVKQYEFTNSKGEKVSIRQDKPAKYGDPKGVGDQGKHYNAGKVGENLSKQHHNYNQ